MIYNRFARQIAELKSKLAEKDAALLGGFGSVSNMVLNELPSQTTAQNSSATLPPIGTNLTTPPTVTSAKVASSSSGGFRIPTPPASLASLKR